MASATIASWHRDFFKYSMAVGEKYQCDAVGPLPIKPKTIFHQRYQTECQQTDAAYIENALNPWINAWSIFGAQHATDTLQDSDESISISCDSDNISGAEQWNQDIQHEALDLSMETQRRRNLGCITDWQLEGSWNQAVDFHEETKSKTEEEAAIFGEQSTSVTDVSIHEERSKQNEINENPAILKIDQQQKKKKREFGIAHQIVPKHLKCPHCDYKSTSTSNLSRHVRVHRTTKQYRCETCKKEFDRSEHLRAHAKTHYQTALPYKCNVCGRGFVREPTKSVHESRCNNRMVYGCVKCKYQSDDLNQFLEHFDVRRCQYDI